MDRLRNGVRVKLVWIRKTRNTECVRVRAKNCVVKQHSGAGERERRRKNERESVEKGREKTKKQTNEMNVHCAVQSVQNLERGEGRRVHAVHCTAPQPYTASVH